jgi:hypothetical protein
MGVIISIKINNTEIFTVEEKKPKPSFKFDTHEIATLWEKSSINKLKEQDMTIEISRADTKELFALY